MVKWTVKQSYSRAEYLPKKIRGYIDLFRPFTLLVALFSGLALTIGVAGHYGVTLSQSWRTAIYVATTFAIVTAASNALNQVTDAAEDRISKPYRPIPQGVVSEQEALTLAYMLYFAGMARAFITSISFGLIVMLIALITITYSLHPVRLKKRFVINNLSLAVARGPLPVFAVWYIYGTPTAIAKTFAGALLIYLFAGTAAKDFHDVEGDLEVGNDTLPVVFGAEYTVALLLPFFLFPYLLFLFTPALRPLLLTAPLALTVVITLRSHVSELMEYNKAWILNYLNLALLYIGFAYILY